MFEKRFGVRGDGPKMGHIWAMAQKAKMESAPTLADSIGMTGGDGGT